MTYETVNWEAEARRVARAFGCDEVCYFQEFSETDPVELGEGDSRHLCWEDGIDWHTIDEREKLIFYCVYHEEVGRTYTVEWTGESRYTGVAFGWDGNLNFMVEVTQHAPIVAKGLFHLGLLTPEVESGLQVSISAHQKLEWALEYEARNDL